MSERAITDPTEHGWVDAGDGKWMWGGSGGGSGNGSIQDGDTEGQITTWSGTEWTPEGAVVVNANGRVDLDNELVVKDKVYLRRQSGDLELPIARYWDGTGKPLAGTDNKGDQLAIGASGGTGLALITKDEKRVEIDDNGNVYITGKLFINGEEVSAGGGGGLWTDNGDGTITANYIAKATNFQTL